ASATDNCDASPVLTQSPTAGTLVSGTTTVTVTATDVYGNASTCTFQLIVVDNTAPVITVCAVDVTEQLDGSCELSLPDYTGLVTATDNCDLSLTVTQSPLAGTILSGDGTVQTVVITVTDDNGNSTTCSFDVTLEDTVVPVITCPAVVNVVADAGSCFATGVALGSPTTSANCGVATVTNN
ncbi:MAG: hypothetical protein KDC12_11420, partial [Flavobacteriales bacterium]|nr:hypothetical protein [Flavobacteriales bacterium]